MPGKAALAFTEALTWIAPHGVSDVLYRSVAEHYSEVEISGLNLRSRIIATSARSPGGTWRWPG